MQLGRRNLFTTIPRGILRKIFATRQSMQTRPLLRLFHTCSGSLEVNIRRQLFHLTSTWTLQSDRFSTTDHNCNGKAMQQQQQHNNHYQCLDMTNVNPHILEMEYAVRGPLVTRATEIEKELSKGVEKPFKTVIRANIGDAHAMLQRPVTFIRQVVSGCAYPKLLETDLFPQDVKDRVRRLLTACGGHSVGSYSASVGIETIREDVAKYICERDGGIASNPDNIILSNGASESIRGLLKMFNKCDQSGKLPGIMIPIPQYPLYSATVVEYGMHLIGYYLDEENNWGLNVGELKRALEESRAHCNPVLLCVINPGNPTGQVLTRENIEEVVRFAHENKLFLFADETTYTKHSPNFIPSKKFSWRWDRRTAAWSWPVFILHLKDTWESECGLRGGYAEIVNMDPEILAMYKKSISAKLCPSVLGQIVMDCVVQPPKPGDLSYELFIKLYVYLCNCAFDLQEKTEILKTLKEKATKISNAFNSVEGIKCNAVQGAMYAFPRLFLPEKAIQKAKSLGQKPDFYYAMNLLESTGICVVPGSGFGQKEGTFHFRTTILPPPDIFEEMIQRLTAFQKKFLADHGA
ncbi:aminotransferase, classes I and II superfamily [Trichinella spiralis]|uniref:aminotransferase, classes I and II superfamily n=1 Tax=Trichinella spiralis TaxID=6334 RepID=UPI0001EFEEBB|nr:aminotransferase, classes I and II superfamily [Trichinella spiralis]